MPSLTRAAVAVVALSLLAVSAQTPAPEQERTFPLTAAKSAQEAQSLVNLIRTVADIRQLSLASDERAINARGTSTQIAVADWLFSEFDNPAPQGLVIRSFPVPGGTDDVARVVHLPNVSAQQVLEIVNLVRTLGDVQRMFPFGGTALAMRGTPAQADLVEWLVRALVDPGAQTRSPAVYEYRAMGPPSLVAYDAVNSAVLVFYLKNVATPQGVQEIVNLARTIADCQRMMVYNERKVIALRATPAKAALVEWLVSELDKPAPPAGDSTLHEYPLSGSLDGRREIDPPEVVRIVHPTARNAQELQAIMTRMQSAGVLQRTMLCTSQGAIALRGTVSQVNLAELSAR
jgi:hypothetical protein